MKITRFNDGQIGVVVDDRIHDITALVGEQAGEWPPMGIVRLIRDFAAQRERIASFVAGDAGIPLSNVRLLTPVPWPNKLIAYPVNYVDHATEMNSVGFANVQGFFLKANSSLVGPHDAIELPALPDRAVHHECELAIIVGKGGREIAEADAWQHIFGYACLLDITVRGKEERVMRKSYDTFTVVGPWIVTADEVADPANTEMRLWVNDELRQHANTRDLIVNIPKMISLASSAATLHPGDIIATGTPAGVGPIVAGDTVRIDIDKVGSMRVPVVQGTRGRNFVFDRSLVG